MFESCRPLPRPPQCIPDRFGRILKIWKQIEKTIIPNSNIKVNITKQNGEKLQFNTLIRIDTEIEAQYYYNGGLLPFVLRKMVNESK